MEGEEKVFNPFGEADRMNPVFSDDFSIVKILQINHDGTNCLIIGPSSTNIICALFTIKKYVLTCSRIHFVFTFIERIDRMNILFLLQS